jgi:hypothetical protein
MVGTKIDRLDVAPRPEIPEVDAMAVLVREQVLGHDSILELPHKGKAGEFECRRAFCWNSMWHNLQRHEVIESSGEVNWMVLVASVCQPSTLRMLI